MSNIYDAWNLGTLINNKLNFSYTVNVLYFCTTNGVFV